MRNDRRAFSHVGSKSARMVEVMMRVDHISDRLVRDQLLHLSNDRKRTLFVQGPFDDYDVIRELDGYAVMGSALEVEHAIADFLRLNGYRWYGAGRRCRSLLRLNRYCCVGFYIRDGKNQYREAALLLDDHRRKFYAAKVFVETVGRLDRHVAKNIVVDPGSHSFDDVLIINVSDNLVLVLQRKRHDIELHSVDGFGFHGRIVSHGSFDETERSEPETKL